MWRIRKDPLDQDHLGEMSTDEDGLVRITKMEWRSTGQEQQGPGFCHSLRDLGVIVQRGIAAFVPGQGLLRGTTPISVNAPKLTTKRVRSPLKQKTTVVFHRTLLGSVEEPLWQSKSAELPFLAAISGAFVRDDLGLTPPQVPATGIEAFRGDGDCSP